MPPKQRTKGQKEIYLENQKTLSFYRNIIIVASVIQVGVTIFSLFFGTASIFWSLFWVIVAAGINGGAYWFMSKMATALLSSGGQVEDAGSDLNVDSGTAEYVKDTIILTASVQCLAALVSNYFWLLWLLAPGYAFYQLWVNLLWPWFRAGSGDDELSDKDKKRQLKREKKLTRKVYN